MFSFSKNFRPVLHGYPPMRFFAAACARKTPAVPVSGKLRGCDLIKNTIYFSLIKQNIGKIIPERLHPAKFCPSPK
jgi:hypothetical protein